MITESTMNKEVKEWMEKMPKGIATIIFTEEAEFLAMPIDKEKMEIYMKKCMACIGLLQCGTQEEVETILDRFATILKTGGSNESHLTH